MMIDLEKKILSGNKELEQKVTNYLLERRGTYESSKCKKHLKARYEKLRNSIDMNFGSAGVRGAIGNQWLSKLAFPLVREQYLLVRAMTKRNFRGSPLITVEPVNNTPMDNAVNMQDVLSLNLKSTMFRETAFDRIVDDVSRYGVGVCYSQFEHREKMFLKTVNTQLGPQRMQVPSRRKNCWNYRVHPLNYFQNDLVADPEQSDFRGYVENVPISSLIDDARRFPDNYLKKNLELIIKDAKADAFRDEYFYSDDKSARDFAKAGVDRLHFWAKIALDGNEDSDITYYCQIVGDKLIRIQSNWLDEDHCPLTVYTMRNRSEYWWGNAWCEDVIPHENFTFMVMNMKAELGLKQLERFIFYPKGWIDPADLAARHMNGGWVPVDLKNNLQMQNAISEFQPRDTSTGDIDWLFREVKESVQKMSPKPDFLRNGNKGGLANNTATAANLINDTIDQLESDCMETFAYALTLTGKKNVLQLQQFLGDQIRIRPNPKAAPKELWKSEILGDFWYTVLSSLHKNTVQEAIRVQNVLTQMINFKGTGDPTWQNVNMVPIARKWISMLDIGDVDDVMPQQQTAPMAMPGMQGQPGPAAGPEIMMQPTEGVMMQPTEGVLNVA